MKMIKYVLLICLLSIQMVWAKPPTYVLVHGAWGGSWSFKQTALALQEAGAEVYRVNLTGLGERVHLANPQVNLSTHVKDVLNTILFDQLEDVILVGHSYGGMVITAVADRIPERIQRLIYLDAFLPEHGESIDFFVSNGPNAALMHSKDQVYVEPFWEKDNNSFPRDVPHPLASMKEKVSLSNPKRKQIPSTYILTYEKDIEKDDFYYFYQRAKLYQWKTLTMLGDHNPQRSQTKELVSVLLKEK
ncbi:alpha/beta hydrolase [Sphingobacterium sp. HJSM2_6]|uniref:alpha/beta hydrolase n=1 Tax=Sphingobacterium sp. HJSM2_6 TaxID=3366264 RepID=UPI003BE2D8EF